MNDKQKALLDAARAVLAQHSMTSAAMDALERAVWVIDDYEPDGRCRVCDQMRVHICEDCGRCLECH
jgi:hypothetical protein